RIKRELDPDFTVTALFKYSSVRLLSQHIVASTARAKPSEPAPSHACPRGTVSAAIPGLPLESPAYLRDSLAIIGISCHFPGASDHRAFWHTLRQGRAAGRFLAEAELQGLGLAQALIRDPHFVPLQITIEDKDCFDPAFFNISRRDAALMDPQARLLLLHSW